MKYTLSLISLLVLSACASTPTAEDLAQKAQSLTSLPPQNLDPGQCGLFIWTAGERRDFIGFETEGEIKLLQNGEVLNVIRSEEGPLGSAQRIYNTSNGDTFTLSLKDTVLIKEGQRFTGSLTTKTKEGWDRVIPIAALTSCLP